MYIVRNHGIFTSHDSGQAYRLLIVTDRQNRGIQRVFFSVQSGEFLPIICPSHDDMLSGNRIEIVSVHRLPVFLHHIVRDIHDIIDGTDAI